MRTLDDTDRRLGPEIAIIGSGFAGLGIAIRLSQSGHSRFTIYEKADRLGGTWRDNIYPGSGCDVPSHLYCFSFEPKPDWRRKFSPQAEILAYLEHCADKYGLHPHIRFEAEIAEARFDAAAGRWTIVFSDGSRAHADILISGTGQLNRPAYPAIPGQDAFEGASFHSARWNHSHDLRGKRVAVIGCGASAIQFIPQIAPKVERLTIFQRTPNWIIPRGDKTYSSFAKWLFEHVPGCNRAYRAYLYTLLEMRFAAFRKKSRLGKLLEWLGKRHMRAQLPKSEWHKALTPDYPIGAKRILVSDDFYPALARGNVDLVTAAIDRIGGNGIVTGGGAKHPADTIIYATGFQATDFLAPMKIVGRNGRELNEAWRKGAEAHMGVMVSGFPNLFLLYGPNTNLGHNSIIFMMERQIDYILQVIGRMQRLGLRYVDVKPEAQRRYNDWVQENLKRSVWDAVAVSWYMTEAGKITNNWPGYTLDYWRRMRRPDWSALEEAPAA